MIDEEEEEEEEEEELYFIFKEKNIYALIPYLCMITKRKVVNGFILKPLYITPPDLISI